jgi:hypothetical protein
VTLYCSFPLLHAQGLLSQMLAHLPASWGEPPTLAHISLSFSHRTVPRPLLRGLLLLKSLVPILHAVTATFKCSLHLKIQKTHTS